MKRRFLAVTFAAVIITALQPAVPRAGNIVLVADRDETARTFTEAASDAGTAAGIVSQCRSDAAPIRSAFERAVEGANLDSGRKQSLWLRYETAESSTLTALARTRTLSCDNTNMIIHDTLHELGQPLS
jgi:hypothetical protein